MKVLEYIKEMKNAEELVKANLGCESNGSITAFRGENKDYNTRLMPSMYRLGYDIINTFEAIENYGIDKNKSPVDKMIDSQHYLAISNILDVTFNCLIALFFAATSEDAQDFSKENEYIYDAYAYTFVIPTKFIAQAQDINEDMKGKLLNYTEKYRALRNDNFSLLLHNNHNPRIIAQSGGFIYFNSDKEAIIPPCFYYKLKIKKEDRKQILSELKKYFNISKSSIFPEKENQSERVKYEIELRKEISANNKIELVDKEMEKTYIMHCYELKSMYNRHKSNDRIEILLKRLSRQHYNKLKSNLKIELNSDYLEKISKYEHQTALYIMNIIRKGV